MPNGGVRLSGTGAPPPHERADQRDRREERPRVREPPRRHGFVGVHEPVRPPRGQRDHDHGQVEQHEDDQPVAGTRHNHAMTIARWLQGCGEREHVVWYPGQPVRRHVLGSCARPDRGFGDAERDEPVAAVFLGGFDDDGAGAAEAHAGQEAAFDALVCFVGDFALLAAPRTRHGALSVPSAALRD